MTAFQSANPTQCPGSALTGLVDRDMVLQFRWDELRADADRAGAADRADWGGRHDRGEAADPAGAATRRHRDSGQALGLLFSPGDLLADQRRSIAGDVAD
jgi:hypothetical protein